MSLNFITGLNGAIAPSQLIIQPVAILPLAIFGIELGDGSDPVPTPMNDGEEFMGNSGERVGCHVWGWESGNDSKDCHAVGVDH